MFNAFFDELHSLCVSLCVCAYVCARFRYMKTNLRKHHLVTGSYNTQVKYMKEVLDYWKNNYNWRQEEALLNKFQHFKTNIEGIDVHFIHVKPKRSTGGEHFYNTYTLFTSNYL